MIKKHALISQTLITVSDSEWENYSLWEMWSWLDRRTTLWNKLLSSSKVNPLNAKLNPICHLLALLEAHHILHVGRVRVKKARSCASTYTSLLCGTSLRTELTLPHWPLQLFIQNIHHWKQNLTRYFTNCFKLLNHVRPWSELRWTNITLSNTCIKETIWFKRVKGLNINQKGLFNPLI